MIAKKIVGSLFALILLIAIPDHQAFAKDKDVGGEVEAMYIPMEVWLGVPPNDPDDDDNQFGLLSLVKWQIHISGGIRGTETNPSYKVNISDNVGKLNDSDTVYPFEVLPEYGISYRSTGDVRACATVTSNQTGEVRSACKTIKIVKVD